MQACDFKKDRKDKRRAARTAIRIPINIRLETNGAGDWSAAMLINISVRGARLQTSKMLAIGDSFLLRLPQRQGAANVPPMICRVAYCETQRSGFTIGAEFVGRLQEQPAAASSADLEKIRRSILD